MDLWENFGRRLQEKREKEGLGLRAAAKLMGITHATLSRVEKGFHADMATYRKMKRWLSPDHEIPAEIEDAAAPQVHFRREKTISPELAQSLAQMILRAQAMWGLSKDSEGASE
jgi:transcriptional regulator with XRE-family HTH domain